MFKKTKDVDVAKVAVRSAFVVVALTLIYFLIMINATFFDNAKATEAEVADVTNPEAVVTDPTVDPTVDPQAEEEAVSNEEAIEAEAENSPQAEAVGPVYIPVDNSTWFTLDLKTSSTAPAEAKFDYEGKDLREHDGISASGTGATAYSDKLMDKCEAQMLEKYKVNDGWAQGLFMVTKEGVLKYKYMSNRVQGDYWEVEYTVTPVEIAGRTPIWLDNNGYEIETSEYYNHNFSIKGGFNTTFTLSYKNSTNPFRVDISRDGSATFDVWDHELSGGSEIELSAQTSYTPYNESKGVDLYPGKSTCYYRVYEDGVLEMHLQAFLGPFEYYQTCYFTPNAEEGVESVWYCNDSVMEVGEVYAFDLYTQYNFKLSYDQPADESYVSFNAYPNPGYGTFQNASEAPYTGPIKVVTGDKIYRDANDDKKLIIERKNGTKETWTGVGHEGHTTFDNWSEFEQITVAPGRYYSLQANFHSDNVVVSIRSANKELGTLTPEVEDRLVKYGSKVETSEDAEGNLIITITEPEAADPIYTSVVNPNERSEFKEWENIPEDGLIYTPTHIRAHFYDLPKVYFQQVFIAAGHGHFECDGVEITEITLSYGAHIDEVVESGDNSYIVLHDEHYPDGTGGYEDKTFKIVPVPDTACSFLHWSGIPVSKRIYDTFTIFGEFGKSEGVNVHLSVGGSGHALFFYDQDRTAELDLEIIAGSQVTITEEIITGYPLIQFKDPASRITAVILEPNNDSVFSGWEGIESGDVITEATNITANMTLKPTVNIVKDTESEGDCTFTYFPVSWGENQPVPFGTTVETQDTTFGKLLYFETPGDLMPANYVLCNPAYGSEFLGWRGLPEDGKIEGNVTIKALVGKVTKINAAVDTENSSGDLDKCIVTDQTTKKVSSLTQVKQDFDPESHGGTNILQFTNPIYVDEAGYVNYAYVEAGADPETVFIRWENLPEDGVLHPDSDSNILAWFSKAQCNVSYELSNTKWGELVDDEGNPVTDKVFAAKSSVQTANVSGDKLTIKDFKTGETYSVYAKCNDGYSLMQWKIKKTDGTLTDVRDMVDGDLNFVAVVVPNENKVNFAVTGDTRAHWVNATTGEAVTSLTALSGSKYTSYYNSDEAKAYVTITDAETNGATTYVTKPEVVNDGTVICKSLDNVGDNVVIAGEDVTFTADFTFINSPASTPKTGDSINLTKLVILCMFIGLMITAFGYRRRFIRR